MSSTTLLVWFIAMAIFTLALLGLGFALLSGSIQLPGRKRKKPADESAQESRDTARSAADRDRVTAASR